MKTRFALGAVSLALLSLATAATAAGPTREALARMQIDAFRGHTLSGPGQDFKARAILVDANGTTHSRFDRSFQGMPVIGGDLVVHSDAVGNFREATQTLRHLIMPVAKLPISAATAIKAAMAAHPIAEDLNVSPQRVVYARGESPAHAYDVRLFGTSEDGSPMELHVIVDGHTGQILESWDDFHTAAAAGTGNSFFNGTIGLTTDLVSGTYYLRDPSRGNQYTVDMKGSTSGSGTIFSDADNTWGNSALTDRATVGVDAQYGTAVTWDYYKNVHGRNGIANDGKGSINRVHYGRNYANAGWRDSCFCMIYGDGDGTTNPFDSLDVAGHEMTHGVTSRTAKLVYSRESGGLNEGTSDIFGTLVEFYANNPSDPADYLIGERVLKNGKALRYMYQPSADGRSADCAYASVGSLNVHFSSGVPNHFFYLLAEGTAPNSFSSTGSKTCKSTDTRVASGSGSLTGIGRDAAGKIWYRALTVYMTSSTNFSGARTATLKAATDLYGAGSSQVNAVAAAWTAVNVN